MNIRILSVIVLLLILACGCAFFKQAAADYSTGTNDPAIVAKAQQEADAAKTITSLGVAAVPIAPAWAATTGSVVIGAIVYHIGIWYGGRKRRIEYEKQQQKK